MPNFGAWHAAPHDWGMGTNERAYMTEKRIRAKPTSVVVYRNGAALPAQTVRLDPARGGAGRQVDPNASDATGQALIIGYKDHPVIADTNIQHGDQLLVDGLLYDVVQVIPETQGSLQLLAEVSSG